MTLKHCCTVGVSHIFPGVFFGLPYWQNVGLLLAGWQESKLYGGVWWDVWDAVGAKSV